MKKSDKSKKIVTLQFGEITVDQDYIFNFPGGILGFEDLREFVLINEEETAPFKWLVSIEEPQIGFPLLSPWLLDLEYNPGRNFDLEKQVFFSIITLEDENRQMTANMKAPIILTSDTQLGEQVILHTEKYSTNFVIGKQ